MFNNLRFGEYLATIAAAYSLRKVNPEYYFIYVPCVHPTLVCAIAKGTNVE